MEQTQKRRKHAGRYILIAIIAVLVFLAVAFFSYVKDYRHADETALSLLQNNPSIRQQDNMTILTPDAANDTGRGLVFYPGGKVEDAAYLPILNQLREHGITVVLVKMPFNLAVFDSKAADKVPDAVPSVSRWYIGGHSLGGAMASSFVAGKEDRFSGLILLGAYPVNDSPVPTLCIYGSEDVMLDQSKLSGVKNVLELVGGNHAQFGNYGTQDGDGVATISRDEQQTKAAEAMLAFLTMAD